MELQVKMNTVFGGNAVASSLLSRASCAAGVIRSASSQARHGIRPAANGTIVAVVASFLDCFDGALLAWDMVQLAADLLAEGLRHAGLADARRPDKEPRGRVGLRAQTWPECALACLSRQTPQSCVGDTSPLSD